MDHSKSTEVNEKEVFVINNISDENLVTKYYLTTNLKKPQGELSAEMSVFTGNASNAGNSGNAPASSPLPSICNAAADAIFPFPRLLTGAPL